MARSNQSNLSTNNAVGALCVLAALVLLLMPDRAQIQTSHMLSQVLVNPWLEIRNFGEDVIRVRAENARLSAEIPSRCPLPPHR